MGLRPRITATRHKARATIGAGATRLRRLVTAPGRWWTELEPAERVLYRAVALLGAGAGLVYPPAAFIVPGVLFALAFFGFSFRRA